MTPSDNELLIKRIAARQILDSRGNPTVEVDVKTSGGFGRASVPSGASTGRHEALELRDGDWGRFGGRGVLKAVQNVNERIAPQLVGRDASKQSEIDNLVAGLDGTENKSRLGANAILGVSLAIARAAANTSQKPLFEYLGGLEARTMPIPMMNVLNGGRHAGGGLAIQEFMIMPIGADTFGESLRMGVEVFQCLRAHLQKTYSGSATNVGDEGGFAPPMRTSQEALESLVTAIEGCGYDSKSGVVLCVDSAASEFYDSATGTYAVDGKKFDRDSLLGYYEDLIDQFPVRSLEDPFHEDDFESFAEITRRTKIQIVGDDLFVTNPRRIRRGIEMHACNAIVTKFNQVGTLTEAIQASRLALENGYRVVVSHRSGETEDSFVSDFAVALNTGQIKTGAPCRGERVAKYNQLLRIEEELGPRAIFLGAKSLYAR